MKKTLAIFGIVMLILYISCKKLTGGVGEVYGKWKLTETYIGPGDGSGK